MSPPRGLRVAGKRLWASVDAAYEMSAVEEDELRRICELADLRESLRHRAADDFRVAAEVRKMTESIAKMLASLTDDQEQPSLSARAQAMARERWRKEHSRVAGP